MRPVFLFVVLFLVLVPGTAFCADLVLMVLDHNSYVAGRVVRDLDVDADIRVITADDVKRRPNEMKIVIDGAPVVVVDVMGRELESFLTENIKPDGKTIYALRGSLDDETLKKKGFIFDPEVSDYYRHLSAANIRNMLRLVIHRHMDTSVAYAPVEKRPEPGIYHPDAGELFTQADAYLKWQQQRPGFTPGRPRIGLLFFSSFLTEGQHAQVDYIIERLEESGFFVMPCYGREGQIIPELLLDEQKNARVDMVLAFSFKFYSTLTPALAKGLVQLDVPVFNAVGLYLDTIEEWRKSPVGIDKLEVSWSLAVPEISGLIEPTVLAAKQRIHDSETGKPFFLNRPVTENLDRLIPRLKNWMTLRTKPNPEKRVALMFYNHHQGKQNIGASYLNVFRSIARIFTALEASGYTVGKPLSEQEVKSLILASARNIGSWAPGELDNLLSAGRAVRIPVRTYQSWFEELPGAFKEQVVAQWGRPGDAKIMRDGDDLIIPAVRLENTVLLPEPARGWGDEPMKLYHDTTLYPHHQYLAAYLWLKKEFQADAMIHLGTHATYEWTPGKQAGLSPACPPEVLITDILNIYPYIVDNVGEGIQAKRRGRGVMVSHLTPVLKQSDLDREYSRMAALINEIERARSRGSATLEEKIKELTTLAETTGILEDLKSSDFGHAHGDYHEEDGNSSHVHGDPAMSGDADARAETVTIDSEAEETIHLLGHYLEEIKSTMIPFGMHTFGVSPGPDAAKEMTAAMVRWNPGTDINTTAGNLARSGPDELGSMIRGLAGRYVPPGQGNDPLRNPAAIPTGRNFYGFNPGKLPSPAAWELGKRAAQKIIDNHIIKHGSYPQKVAVVLWATETLRNEGVNESTILNLVGVKPKWSPSGRVIGLDLISGSELNRARIDVMVNASGLYRDMFPDKMDYIDRAIRMAARQTDVENLIARHDLEIKTRLIRQGMSPEAADEMSRFRVFSEPPGAYGTGVGNMASGSSKWENPDQVVDVFQNRMGFAFGRERWGIEAKDVLRENLAGVDVTVHSRSSNVYGVLDNDDVFQYLGGLSMAVRKESGKAPETLITQQQKHNRVDVEDVGKTLGREMRARYLNPKWIKGMKAEDYAGARAMSDFVEYLWGWNMTTPEKVDAAKWQQTYEVYVKDKYGLDLKTFFDKASPWAFQSMTGRMLETQRKGYWQPDQAVLETLAVEYAKSVITKGVACCDHTCNNPLLNQMVVSIISVPGVLSPELVEQFKLAIEKMAKTDLAQQVENRKRLLEQLAAPSPEQAAEQSAPSADDSPDSDMVEGYKMENMNSPDETTRVTSSGIEWMAVIAVLAVIGLCALGARKRKL
ncbi:MAG: cobaltochelatase subunit CobN [Desulfobacter sp.]